MKVPWTFPVMPGLKLSRSLVNVIHDHARIDAHAQFVECMVLCIAYAAGAVICFVMVVPCATSTFRISAKYVERNGVSEQLSVLPSHLRL